MSENNGPPERIKITHDDYHAKYIGRTADGRQFFLSNAFDWAIDDKPGREYVVLFLFDSDGTLVEDHVDVLGSRKQLGGDSALPGNKADLDTIEDVINSRLAELGDIDFGDIELRPFEIERYGTKFGFIAIPPDDPEDDWWVEFHPGNFMAFSPPWDGDYDT